MDSLYLEYPVLSISRTKCSVPWNFPQEHCIAFLCFKLPYLKLFTISNKCSGPLNHFLSLSWTSTYSNFKINSNLNQNKNFDCKWKKTKHKLNKKTLKEKCDILARIEKGMTNKEVADKLCVPKNTISTWNKNKEIFFQALEESAPSTKKLHGCQ